MSVEIRHAADRLDIFGKMTLETAAALLERGAAAISAGATLLDLAAAEEVDSSGIAVLFGWQRAAAEQGKALRVVNAPASLVSLAEVYGVSDLLPISGERLT